MTSEKVNESNSGEMRREPNSQKNPVKSSTRNVAEGILGKIRGLDVTWKYSLVVNHIRL